jgi:multidrug efflux pump
VLARFFASRPVFAWVIAISVILAGIVSIRALPVAAYPDVALPNVRVATGFPGASAQTVENSVTQVLEQQLTGIDGLLYFSSSSNSAGQARIDVTFKQGFDLQLQAVGIDRGALAGARDQLLAAASKDPRLTAVRRADLPETPQLHIDIDPAKAVAHGVAVPDIASTLAAAWGGVYVNDFIDRGLVKRVFVQGDAQFRSRPEDLDAWSVRGESGAMTPFSAFATTRWAFGAESLSRFNGLAAFDIQGLGAPGVSSGVAMAEIARLAGTIPGTTSSWSGLAYQEQLASGQTLALYGISILVIFLCLAALYESWSVPFSVLLVIPLGIVGAVLAATLRGLDNDVYFRVALITTIGLSSKNAILIVEFAEAAYHRGASLVDAAVTGARLRLRPILMTSLAFVAGVTPLVVSTGPGANSRVSIGTGIVGGTVTGTAIAVFFVPVFFVIVRRLVRTRQLPRV